MYLKQKQTIEVIIKVTTATRDTPPTVVPAWPQMEEEITCK